jgi:hypothetical protein
MFPCSSWGALAALAREETAGQGGAERQLWCLFSTMESRPSPYPPLRKLAAPPPLMGVVEAAALPPCTWMARSLLWRVVAAAATETKWWL